MNKPLHKAAIKYAEDVALVGGGNPWPLVVEALNVTYEILDMKYLDGGVIHTNCKPAREIIAERRADFERLAKYYDERFGDGGKDE